MNLIRVDVGQKTTLLRSWINAKSYGNSFWNYLMTADTMIKFAGQIILENSIWFNPMKLPDFGVKGRERRE